nr:hypothetical protein Itr_chr13CG17010 [Ipomoea trifida]
MREGYFCQFNISPSRNLLDCLSQPLLTRIVSVTWVCGGANPPPPPVAAAAAQAARRLPRRQHWFATLTARRRLKTRRSPISPPLQRPTLTTGKICSSYLEFKPSPQTRQDL